MILLFMVTTCCFCHRAHAHIKKMKKNESKIVFFRQQDSEATAVFHFQPLLVAEAGDVVNTNTIKKLYLVRPVVS